MPLFMQPSRSCSGVRCAALAAAMHAGAHAGAQAQHFGGAQAWLARYNGPSSYWEELHDLALGERCVYVAGFSYNDVTTDFATVKYDYAGRRQWVRRYGLGGVNDGASAQALAVDGAGNVLVTGRSADYRSDAEFSVDAATLKYDAAGNLLWEQRYRLPGGNNSQPLDIAVDSAGNVYVAGASWVGTGFDLMLLKYSAGGALLWARTAGKSEDRWDAGYSLAIDADGNPVVAGYTQPYFFNPVTFGYLVKFSAGGAMVWEREHESATNASAWWQVAINGAGHIYTSGEIAPPGDLSHIWTSQYDADGTLLWDRHYDGNASGSNFKGGMALTPTGGVVVCGVSDDIGSDGGVTNIVTLRYEADGTEAWRRLDRAGYDQAGGRDVAVDTLGNAYVTGWAFNSNENMDFVTLKYTPAGTFAWAQVLAGPAGATDWPSRVAVDGAQNVFVAGDVHGGLETYFDFATVRYRQIGTAAARR